MKFANLYPGKLTISRSVNSKLCDRVTSLERQCWANNQYTRRECLEIIGLPENTENGNLEALTLKVLNEIGVNIDSRSWYINDSTTSQGNVLENITSQFGLQQIINEPTHIRDNSSSCIDLIFTSQANLIIESGVYPSLHPNCHHQLVYAKFNLQICYPPQYYREV